MRTLHFKKSVCLTILLFVILSCNKEKIPTVALTTTSVSNNSEKSIEWKNELYSYNLTFSKKYTNPSSKKIGITKKGVGMAFADAGGAALWGPLWGAGILGAYGGLWCAGLASWGASSTYIEGEPNYGNTSLTNINTVISEYDAGINTFNSSGEIHDELLLSLASNYTSPFSTGTTINPAFESADSIFNLNYLTETQNGGFMSTYFQSELNTYTTFSSLNSLSSITSYLNSVTGISTNVMALMSTIDTTFEGSHCPCNPAELIDYANGLESLVISSSSLTSTEQTTCLESLAILKYSYTLWYQVIE